MKPRILKIGGLWWCSSRFFGVAGHALTAWGDGSTPKEAYDQWSKHWGIEKYGK